MPGFVVRRADHRIGTRDPRARDVIGDLAMANLAGVYILRWYLRGEKAMLGSAKLVSGFVCVLGLLSMLEAFQKPFRQYHGVEYYEFETPPDWQEKTEWAFARLMFPGGGPGVDGYYPRFQGNWREGSSLWTQDYPRADRHFAQAVRRLTRIHARSVEQPIDLEDGNDVYNWPWLYAVQVGEWGLTSAEAKILREYLLRGGFFMADDFHGDFEWEVFKRSMQLVFPDRQILDIPDKDAYFHVVYDLDDRYQIPGQAHVRLGFKQPIQATSPTDGKGDHWRAIVDDHGRIMVAISYNSDIGDSWEFADDPAYPEKYSALGIRVGVNDVVYAMTH
jgi:hypothetical protein